MAFVSKDFFNNQGVFKILYSPQIQHRLFIHNNYNLNNYSNPNDNCLFVGCFWTSDIMNIKNNNVVKCLLWIGDDIINLKNINSEHFNFLSQIPNLKHFCLNESSQKLLFDQNIQSTILNLDLTEKIIINKIDFFIRDYIFILDKDNKTCLDHKFINYNNILLQSKININYIYKFLPYIKFVIRLNYNDLSLDTILLINYFQKFYIPIFSNDKFYNSIKYIDNFNLNNLIVITNKNLFYKNYFSPQNIDFDNIYNIYKFNKPQIINKIFYIKNDKSYDNNIQTLNNLNINFEIFDPTNTSFFNILVLILFHAKKEQIKNILILNKFSHINKNILKQLEVFHDEFMNKKILNITNDKHNVLNGLLINFSIYDDLFNLLYKYNFDEFKKIIHNNYKIKFINNLININSIDLPITETSLILFVQNNSSQILQCLEAIYNQNYKNFKLIIINNNSVDDSTKIINKFINDFDIKNFFLINNYETLKVSTCINNAIKIILNDNSGFYNPTSKFITWFKTDFIPANNFINELTNIFFSNQNASCTFANYTLTHPNSFKISKNPFFITDKTNFLINSDGFKAFLLKTDIFNHINLLDEEIIKVENLDFTLRCFENTDFTFYFSDAIVGSFIDSLYISPEEFNNIIQQEEFLYKKLIYRYTSNNKFTFNFNNYCDNYSSFTSLEKNNYIVKFCENICNSKKKSIKNTIGKSIPDFILDVYDNDRNNIKSIEYLNKWALSNKDKNIIEKTFQILNEQVINDIKLFLSNKTKTFIVVSNINNNIFERQHFIIKNFDKSYAKFFIGNIDNSNNYVIDNDIFYINRNIYNTLKNYILDNNFIKLIYFSEVSLSPEIFKYKKYFKNITTLFDIACITECNYPQLFESSLLNADKVFYSHPAMIDIINSVCKSEFDNKNFFYLPNGSEQIFINPPKLNRPFDIPYTDRPILGYIGDCSIIDYDIIDKYLSNTKYHLVIINQSNSDIMLQNYNLTVLPKKTYDELPNYIAWFDKCFLPLLNSPYLSPQTLWQMIASGKTVLKHGVNLDTSKYFTWDYICNKLLFVSLGFNNDSIWTIIKNHNNISIINLLTLIFNTKISENSDLFINFNKKFNYVDIENKFPIFTLKDIILEFKDVFFNNLSNLFNFNNKLINIDYDFFINLIIDSSYNNIFELNNIIFSTINKNNIQQTELINNQNNIIIFSSNSFNNSRKTNYIASYLSKYYRVFFVYPSSNSSLKEKVINHNLIEITLDPNNFALLNRNIEKIQEIYNFNYFISLILPEDSFWLDCINKIKCTTIYNKHIDWGCNFNHFSNLENNTITGKHIIGYIGDFDNTLDIKLIQLIAKKYTYPKYEIFLIGKYNFNNSEEQQEFKNLKRFRNLRIIEIFNIDDLTKYIPMLSLVFYPGVISDLNDFYLSCFAYGLPIIAKDLNNSSCANLINLNNQPNIINLIDDNITFVNFIDSILTSNINLDIAKNFASNFNWNLIFEPINLQIKNMFPSVSYIVFDNLEIEKTLAYINKNSLYDQYEIIVISNNNYIIQPDYFNNTKLICFDNMLLDSSFNMPLMLNNAIISSKGDFVILIDDNFIFNNFPINLFKYFYYDSNTVSVNPITNLSYHDSQLFIQFNDFIDFFDKASSLTLNFNPTPIETNIISSCVAFRKNDLFSVGLFDFNLPYTAYLHDINFKFKLFNNKSKNLVSYDSICFSDVKFDLPENSNKNYTENKWSKKLPRINYNFNSVLFTINTFDKYLDNLFSSVNKLFNNSPLSNIPFLISDNANVLTDDSILISHNSTHLKFIIPKLSSDISIPKNNDLIQNIYRILFTYSLKLFNNSL